jgi:hypothetical protein
MSKYLHNSRLFNRFLGDFGCGWWHQTILEGYCTIEQDKELGSDCRFKVEVHRLAAEQQSELQNHKPWWWIPTVAVGWLGRIWHREFIIQSLQVFFESYCHYKIDVVIIFVGSFGCNLTWKGFWTSCSFWLHLLNVPYNICFFKIKNWR